MAEDLTKGLNHLLGPKFTELAERIETLERCFQGMSMALAEKEDKIEVDALREHCSSQIRQVDDIVGLLKEKVGQLDELRSRDIRALHASVEQKATAVNLDVVREQLQAMTMSLAARADAAKMEHLARQVDLLGDEVAKRATILRADQLGKQVNHLSDMIARKVDPETTDQIRDSLKLLICNVAEKAPLSDMHALGAKLQSVTEQCTQKADVGKVEQLLRQLDTLEQDVSRKADDAKAEHLRRALEVVTEDLQKKAHHATVEQSMRHIHALSEALSKKSDAEKHDRLHDQFRRLSEDVFQHKMHLDRQSHTLEDLGRRVVADSSKLKSFTAVLGQSASASAGGPPVQPLSGLAADCGPRPPGGCLPPLSGALKVAA